MKATVPQRTTSRVEVKANNTYYVWRVDEEYGPYSINDIRHYWESGNLQSDDFVRESHSVDWIDAGSFLLPLLTSDASAHQETASMRVEMGPVALHQPEARPAAVEPFPWCMGLCFVFGSLALFLGLLTPVSPALQIPLWSVCLGFAGRRFMSQKNPVFLTIPVVCFLCVLVSFLRLQTQDQNPGVAPAQSLEKFQLLPTSTEPNRAETGNPPGNAVPLQPGSVPSSAQAAYPAPRYLAKAPPAIDQANLPTLHVLAGSP